MDVAKPGTDNACSSSKSATPLEDDDDSSTLVVDVDGNEQDDNNNDKDPNNNVDIKCVFCALCTSKCLNNRNRPVLEGTAAPVTSTADLPHLRSAINSMPLHNLLYRKPADNTWNEANEPTHSPDSSSSKNQVITCTNNTRPFRNVCLHHYIRFSHKLHPLSLLRSCDCQWRISLAVAPLPATAR